MFRRSLKDIVPSTNDRDSYFLNLSDGMLMFSNQGFNYYNDVDLDTRIKLTSSEKWVSKFLVTLLVIVMVLMDT